MDHTSSSKAPFEGNTGFVCFSLGETSQPSQGEFRKLEPEWLESLLKKAFSERCSEPHCPRDNLNKYCIDCDASLCRYCVKLSSHGNHRCLKIYRLHGKYVVPVDDIEQHIEYSQIQQHSYNNGLRVLALTPQPHQGAKGSDNEAKCVTCSRKLIRNQIFNFYCSISCKAKAFTQKVDYESPPFLSLEMLVPNGRQGSEEENLIADYPVKKAKLDCDCTNISPDLAVKKEEITRSKMIVDERVPTEELNLNKTSVGYFAELTGHESWSEDEMIVSEILLLMGNQTSNSTKSAPRRLRCHSRMRGLRYSLYL